MGNNCNGVAVQNTPSIGKQAYFDGLYNLEQSPEVEIKLREQKEKFNVISKRNDARNRFQSQINSLINTVETYGGDLTPADKREFRELFQDLIASI